MTLIGWLRAQLDADERVAHLACEDPEGEIVSGRWKVSAHESTPSCVADDEGRMVVDSATTYPQYEQGVLAHIAAWDPARVLAEVKAKRAILDGYEASYRQSDDYPGWEGAMYWIAQPYAGRDGWQPEWSVGE